MATREENLKKINDQLEQLSDDELEKVAGGAFRGRHQNISDNPKQENQKQNSTPVIAAIR